MEAKFEVKTVPNPDAVPPVAGAIRLVATLNEADLDIAFDCGAINQAEKDALFEDLFGECLILNSAKVDVVARVMRVIESKQNSAKLGGKTEVVPRPEGSA